MGWINLLYLPRFFESDFYNQLTRCLKCWYEQWRGRTIDWIGQFQFIFLQCRSIRKTYLFIHLQYALLNSRYSNASKEDNEAINYLSIVSEQELKERENLFGWMLPLWCLSCQAQTADVHTHTRTSDSLTNTHTNISQILSQTLSLVILHALFLQALNGIYFLLLLFTSIFILKVNVVCAHYEHFLYLWNN